MRCAARRWPGTPRPAIRPPKRWRRTFGRGWLASRGGPTRRDCRHGRAGGAGGPARGGLGAAAGGGRRPRPAVFGAAAGLVTGVIALAVNTWSMLQEERRTAEQRDRAEQ